MAEFDEQAQTKPDTADGPRNDDGAALKRAAHKIAWTRMNGRNDLNNPFVEENGLASGGPGDGKART